MSLESIFTNYTIGFLVVLAICYVADRIYEGNHRWNISKSRLMTCKHCHHVFMCGRHDRSGKCPVCGRPSASFHFPQSEIKERLRNTSL